ncbi:hypothetical protein TRVL_08135 [Trypanosoma vivax]|uniref:RRM domain-containing protein n=1 Tax=Trypanosoma vivax (strain Y486) TaxID=1055687 RepID=G0TXR7_TRYVY|nr:hypothetical protein TRVL_08135 [Trypanosoma vivax]CCC48759.1 conserved hypothetical protein [Trypanosoma vivax Y486]
MHARVQRFKDGQSGPYTEDYHRLLGCTPWIVVRRLDHCSGNKINSDKNVALSEGDVATVFSQFGEVLDVRFVRHSRTGRFLGTAFVKFSDYRSSILAADIMNSHHEKGKEVRLTAVAVADGARGIEVGRCDEAEVVSLADGVESFALWVERLR